MPPKPTQRRTSAARLPKRKAITDELLEAAMNVLIIVDTAKKTYTGKLVRYDDESIVISPKTCIHRSEIIAFLETRNAPSKQAAGPAVR